MMAEDDPQHLLSTELMRKCLVRGEAEYLLATLGRVTTAYQRSNCASTPSLSLLIDAYKLINDAPIALDAPFHPRLAIDTPAHKELVSLVACIARGVQRAWSYASGPRNTQLLALLMILGGRVRRRNPRRGGRLIQMFTGEGKTVVVAMASVALALLGHRVDVVTSSESLAERDATSEPKRLAALFGKTVDFVEDETTLKADEDEVHSWVDDCPFNIPGRLITMLCRRIRAEKERNAYRPDTYRPLYTGKLSDAQAAWRRLFPEYNGQPPVPRSWHLKRETYNPKRCYRADIVYGTAMGFQGDLLRHRLKSLATRDVDGQMRPLDVVICDECDALMSDGAVHSTQLSSDVYGMSYLNEVIAATAAQYLGGLQRGVKDATGAVTYLNEDALVPHVTRVLQEALRQGKARADEREVFQIRVPAYLADFAIDQAPRIVESARTAFTQWREQQQYLIGNPDGNGPRPIALNLDTGESQHRMHLSDGLTELLQIKCRLPLGEMRLCDNQLSNKFMFREYNYVFGTF